MQLRREVSGSLLVLWKSFQGELRVIAVGMIYPSRGCSEIGRGPPEKHLIIFHHDLMCKNVVRCVDGTTEGINNPKDDPSSQYLD